MQQSTPAVGKPYAYRIILASTSPRRHELLEILGMPFTVIPPDSGTEGEGVDETPLPGEAPTALVQRLSRLKAQTVVNHLALLSPSDDNGGLNDITIVIAADTIVVFEDKILGKPNDPAEATQMLRLLRRYPHDVYSSFTVAYLPPGQQEWHYITRLHQSKVWIRPYSDKEIEAYVASGSPLDKAGAYGIQDQPFGPVGRLEGCFANVMGLPLGELAAILREIGLSLPEISQVCTQHTGAVCCQTNKVS